MARLIVRHVIGRGGAYYFQPTAKMKQAGFRSEALGRNAAAAFARAEALNAEWDTLRRGAETAETVAPFTLAWAIAAYRASSWWRDLAPSTQGVATPLLAYLEASPLGPAPLRELARPDIREFYDKVSAAHGTWKANDTHKYLSRVLSYAVERGWIATNPAARMGIKDPKPRRVVWTPEQVTAAIDKALELGYPGWARAISIGYDSGQDLMVILDRQWSHFDGEGMDFRRRKTGVASWSPCSPVTLELLGGAKTSIYICTSPAGSPITTRSYFGRVFRQIRAEAGLPPLRFRDLRRTVGSEIYEGGGRLEPILGLTPGSPVQKHYIVPNKAASREAQSRRRGREQ
jgi:integrase